MVQHRQCLDRRLPPRPVCQRPTGGAAKHRRPPPCPKTAAAVGTGCGDQGAPASAFFCPSVGFQGLVLAPPVRRLATGIRAVALTALDGLECSPAVLAFAGFSVRHGVLLRNALGAPLRHKAFRELPARMSRPVSQKSRDRRGSIQDAIGWKAVEVNAKEWPSFYNVPTPFASHSQTSDSPVE
jgi:hypothetical protein